MRIGGIVLILVGLAMVISAMNGTYGDVGATLRTIPFTPVPASQYGKH